ncbi:MAG: L-aspartate oxidase [Acidimicrobiia bacterium]|nr:L-aspartate oxidase [Acidimicrobiia bacterium]
MTTLPIRRHEVLVVGAGIAGLAVALRLPRATLLTNRPLGHGGSTPLSQGGIAAAVGPDDSPRSHADDTVAVSAGIADRHIAELIATGAPEAVAELIGHGADLDRLPDGTPALGREAGHSHRRILHAADATGREVARSLTAAVRSRTGLDIIESVDVVDLVTSGDSVVGALVRGPDGALVVHLAAAVVLATGGYAHCFARTTNPAEVVGDGLAMAARVGAVVADTEFVQFHPTALLADRDPLPLLTEALRGEGAHLVDENGARYLLDAHPDAELAPRDVVAMATYRHQTAGHSTYLDATRLPAGELESRFPTVVALAAETGLDPRVDRLPISPAAHYCMGGVAVDESGRTSVPGLWAVGEVTSTGLHGANRLASNSLLEGLVMSRMVADDVLADDATAAGDAERAGSPAQIDIVAEALTRGEADSSVVAEVRCLLWAYAGVERDEKGLRHAADRLGELPAEQNIVQVARLVVDAALARTESRGAHRRRDHSHTDPGGRRSFHRPEPRPTARFDVVGDDAVQLIPTPAG